MVQDQRLGCRAGFAVPGRIDQIGVIKPDAFRFQVCKGFGFRNSLVLKKREKGLGEKRVIHHGPLQSLVLSLKSPQMPVARGRGDPVGADGTLGHAVLEGMKSKVKKIRVKQRGWIPKKFAVRVHVKSPLPNQRMQPDVIRGKGKAATLYHVSDKRMSNRAVGFVPAADFPTGKVPPPAGKTGLTQCVQRLGPQPDVVDDFGDQNGFFAAETFSRISPARWLW